MRTTVVRSLAFSLLAGLATTIWAADAFAVTPIDSCPRTLAQPGETYVVTANLTSSGTCFIVAADRITLDFKELSLTGDGASGAGVTDDGVGRVLTTVKNAIIDNFETGIDLSASTRSQVLNVSVGLNRGVGIAAGSHTLVKTCVITANDGDGIQVGDFSQVQHCVVNVNAGDGIHAGSHALVTANISFLNSGAGIATDAFSTVTSNEADGNGSDGINTGARSLVSKNSANENGNHGIAVECPGTVTNNEVSGNIGGDLSIPAGCVNQNNQ